MPSPFTIGSDCQAFVNGLQVMAGSIEHSFTANAEAYSVLGVGDLLAAIKPSGEITIETPETAAGPLDLARTIWELTQTPAVLNVVDIATGRASTANVAVGLSGKSRKAKSPATRSYKLVIAAGELEI